MKNIKNLVIVFLGIALLLIGCRTNVKGKIFVFKESKHMKVTSINDNHVIINHAKYDLDKLVKIKAIVKNTNFYQNKNLSYGFTRWVVKVEALEQFEEKKIVLNQILTLKYNADSIFPNLDLNQKIYLLFDKQISEDCFVGILPNE